MDTAVVQQFLSFFNDFIGLCQSENWPDDNTIEQEFRNAFLMSKHIEKCLDKLQKKGIMDEFLSALNSHIDTSSNTIKSCLLDPPKYILKKIINSNTKMCQMDISFKIFLEVFSEDKLEQSLSILMVDAASKETLLCNLNNGMQKETILKFKGEVLLSEFSNCDLDILEMIHNCNQATIELLVYCLLNNDPKYTGALHIIKNAFQSIINNKDCAHQHFWKMLFKVDDKYFIEMCAENLDIHKLIVEALLDCGKLLREGMSSESFYIDLDKSELQTVVERICANDCLRAQFFDIAEKYDSNVDFWHNML